jgi:LysR family transcriptional regulator, hydrogen peroxide-inducible genes activator
MMMSTAPQPFSLRQLQYAVAVAEALNFRKAAERCHVSQPSLSAQLAQLEEVLGVRLFERDRRRVLVTAAGHEVVERARRVLIEADDLLEAATRARDPLAGSLRIGVIPTIAPYLLPSLTPVLRIEYPRLTFLWVEDKTDALVRSLDAGTLDAALLALEADLGAVEHEVIARDDFVLATPRDHALGSKTSPVRSAELCDVSMLLLDEGHCLREQALAFCSDAKARELEFRATSLSTLVQMVAGGSGITLLPSIAVDHENPRGLLAIRPFAKPVPHRTIGLAWRRCSPLAGSLRAIAATARGAFEAATMFTFRQTTTAKRKGTHRH